MRGHCHWCPIDPEFQKARVYTGAKQYAGKILLYKLSFIVI